MKRNLVFLVSLSLLILLSGCTQQNPPTNYGSAEVIFAISEEEGSNQMDSRKIQISLNYSIDDMNKTGPQWIDTFNFPDEWSDIDYWLNITIEFIDLEGHYITIEIESIGWVNNAQRYATTDKDIGHDTYRNGFPEKAVIKAWRLGTGPGCEYGWPNTGC